MRSLSLIFSLGLFWTSLACGANSASNLASNLAVSLAINAESANLPNSVPAPATIKEWCAPLLPRLPSLSLAECQQIELSRSGQLSPQGFPLFIRDFPVAHAKGKKSVTRVLMLGGIHGDELSASSLVFKWLLQMQKSQTHEFHWKVAPLLNPDGLLAKKPSRTNARGVDLNRNFPSPNWAQDAPRYWEQRTKRDPRRYPGPAEVSEIETRWVVDLIEKFKPHVIISVHAPFGVLDLDGPADPPLRFGRLLYKPVGVYPGSLGNYSGLNKKIPVLTIELPHASRLPDPKEMQGIWQDMQTWIRKNLAP